MSIDSSYLTAAAFRFEAARGANHSEFETEIIEDAGLGAVSTDELARTLWDWLAAEGADSPLRSSAYWAIGKRGDPRDLVPLAEALQRELPLDPDSTYQIMIALDNLSQPVFPAGQREHSSRNQEGNQASARHYLAARH